jgi:hypothetical protein
MPVSGGGFAGEWSVLPQRSRQLVPSLLLISQSATRSPVCHNEKGAVSGMLTTILPVFRSSVGVRNGRRGVHEAAGPSFQPPRDSSN